MNETYKLIEALRKAEEKFFEDNNLEGAFWRTDITVNEMDVNFEVVLKRVIDEGRI